MDLTVVTKLGPEGTDAQNDGLVKKHLQAKLEKLEQRWGKPLVARASLVEETDGFECTVTLHATPDLVGKAREGALLAAVDAATDKLTRQFEDATDKRTGRERQRRGSGTIKQAGPF